MYDDTLSMVEEFHSAFRHPINDIPNVRNQELNKLRLALLYEELGELRDALAAGDAIHTLDALCDLQYVLDGAFLALGFHNMKQDAMLEVHSSNMSKLGEDGEPVYRNDGKILKGPNYRPANLAGVLDKYNPQGVSNDS